MILWRGKPWREKQSTSGSSLRSWRWVLEADWFGWRTGGSIGFERQYKLDDAEEFRTGTTGYYLLSLTPHFKLGPSHTYYDGPHCAFSIGFLHLNWSNGWCTKCSGE